MNFCKLSEWRVAVTPGNTNKPIGVGVLAVHDGYLPRLRIDGKTYGPADLYDDAPILVSPAVEPRIDRPEPPVDLDELVPAISSDDEWQTAAQAAEQAARIWNLAVQAATDPMATLHDNAEQSHRRQRLGL